MSIPTPRVELFYLLAQHTKEIHAFGSKVTINFSRTSQGALPMLRITKAANSGAVEAGVKS